MSIGGPAPVELEEGDAFLLSLVGTRGYQVERKVVCVIEHVPIRAQGIFQRPPDLPRRMKDLGSRRFNVCVFELLN